MSHTADSTLLFADSSLVSSSGGSLFLDVGVPAPRSASGGNMKRGKRPPYWWQAQHEDLSEFPKPAEPKSKEVANEVLVRLQAIWRDLDEREVKFKRMMAECDRLAKLLSFYVQFHEYTRLLDETKQRIYAAEDARRAREDDAEFSELMELV